MNEEDLPIIDESEFNTQYGDNASDDIPVMDESEFNSVAPQQTFSLGQQAQDVIGGSAKGYLSGFGKALAFPIDLAATGVADLAASLDAGEFTHVPGKGLADYFGEGLDDLVGNVEGDSAAGRIAERGGELSGGVAGFGGATSLNVGGKVAKFFNANPIKQLLLGEAGGLAGGAVKEAGGSDNQQLAAELATMMGPDLIKGGLKLGKAGLNKLYQPADQAAGEVMSEVLGALDDSTVMTRPTGTSSAQALREEALGQLAKAERTAVGSEVGAAKEALAAVSPELADDAAYLSALKKAKKFPTATTNLDQVSAELDRVGQKLADVPETVVIPSETPLLHEATQGFFGTKGATELANPAREAIDTLTSAKGEFSDLATELRAVFRTSKDISTGAYEEAASKVGARLKQPQAAKAFVELAEGNPEMLSIGKSSLLQNTFSGTPTSWKGRLDAARGSFQELFTPEQIKGLEAVAQKNRNLVGGLMTANATRFLGNKLVMMGLVGGGALGGVPGIAAGYAVGKFAKTASEKPQLMQDLISKAFQSGDAARLLSAKASPENVKAAIKYFENAGRSAIMGVAADDDEIIDLGVIGLSGKDGGGEAQKKSEELPDVDLTPRVAEKRSKQDIVAEIESDPLDATIWEMESSKGQKKSTTESSAKGDFHLIDETARKLGVKNVMDFEDNFNGYKKLKAENQERFGNDPETLYAAHFLGATLLDKYIKDKPITKDWEKKAIRDWEYIVRPRFRKKYAANAKKRTGQVEA